MIARHNPNPKEIRVIRSRAIQQRIHCFRSHFTSGTVNLLDMVKWTIARGWLSSTSTVNQICFGVEMVSTDDADARFEVSAFSIDAKLKTKSDGISNRADGGMHSISPRSNKLTV